MFRRFDIPPVVKNLLIINVILFIAQLSFNDVMVAYGGLFPLGSPFFKFHQILTHMFLHGGFMHLLFNMLVMWSFGSVLERVWNSRRFFIFYFVCGVGAAVFYELVTFMEMQITLSSMASNAGYDWFSYERLSSLQLLPQASVPAIGASGAIVGLTIAFAVLFPNSTILVWFFPAKAKYVAIFIFVFEVFGGISNMNQGIANWAHVGGGITGLLLGYIWKKKGWHLY